MAVHNGVICVRPPARPRHLSAAPSRSDFLPEQPKRLHTSADRVERTVRKYAWLCINARMVNARSSADKDDTVVVRQSGVKTIRESWLVVASCWEPGWAAADTVQHVRAPVEMSPHEVFLPSSLPRVTFTAVVMTDRQRVGNGASFGLVGFIPGVGS